MSSTLEKQFGSKLFATLMVFLKEFFKKVDFEKNQQTAKKYNNYLVGNEKVLPLFHLIAD